MLNMFKWCHDIVIVIIWFRSHQWGFSDFPTSNLVDRTALWISKDHGTVLVEGLPFILHLLLIILPCRSAADESKLANQNNPVYSSNMLHVFHQCLEIKNIDIYSMISIYFHSHETWSSCLILFLAIYVQYKPRSMPHYWKRLLPNCPKSLNRGPDFLQQKSIQLSVVTQKPCHCCSLRVIFTKHFPERKINEKRYYNNVRFFSQFGML